MREGERFMRRFVTGLASVLLALATVGGVAQSASAATAPSGYACGYDLNQGWSAGGDYYCTQKNMSNWWGTGMNNRSSSAAANGASCKYTRYYKSWDFTTDSVYGSYFTLYSEQLMGSNYRDPDLSNGAGFDGAGQNFNNTIEGTWFTGC